MVEPEHLRAHAAANGSTLAGLKTLIVEDDRALADGIASALKNDGHVVITIHLGEMVVNAIARGSFDLLVLDVGLPGIDGFEVLRQLRAGGHRIPVLLLTARDALEDRVYGLEAGADDYLIKPFEIRELTARLRALARRSPATAGSRLTHGPLVLDHRSHRAYLNDTPLDLAAREWAVLGVLMGNVEKVVSKDTIIHAVASGNEELSPNAIEVYMSRLRAKLEHAHIRIRTVRGFGYMLEGYSTE